MPRTPRNWHEKATSHSNSRKSLNAVDEVARRRGAAQREGVVQLRSLLHLKLFPKSHLRQFSRNGMGRRRKLRFSGHVIRRKGLERTIITGKVNGKRKRGRPHLTSWLKDIKSSTGMTLQDAVRAAEDMERWRRIVKTTASHNATSD